MTTLESLRAIFKDKFDLEPEVLQREVTLDELNIDSLSMIEVLFDVEEKFNITVPPEHATGRSQMKTLGDLVDYVEKLIADQLPANAGSEAPS